MTVSSFMILAAAYAHAIRPTTLSAVVMPESCSHIYAIGFKDNYKLSHQPFMLKEDVATTKQLKQNGHNFDMGLGQINARNLEWFSMSLSNLFYPCKNLKAMQTALVCCYEHCYEHAVSKNSSEQTTLQTALSYYDTADFKNGSANAYEQKVASHVGAKTSARLDQESQKSVGFHTEEAEQTMKTEALSTVSEELPDAFTQKASSARDAFTAANASSLEESDNGLELQF
ncbi:lytic transglycosylase domain-containing protein [Bartonella jaculi]|uniref:TrwN protein n=1 Tax=Bartonella jaculi TaxID=686226 RepID=A0ABP9N1W1_9HYPH